MKEPILSGVKFEAAHPPALAVYCSDGRFTEAVEALLRAGGHAYLDTLTIPGGPALLVPGGLAGVAELQAIRRAASFLIAGHKITGVALIAHEGCGFYRERLPGKPAADVQKRQLEDLRAAAREITREHRGVAARGFYAQVVEGEIVFHRVD